MFVPSKWKALFTYGTCTVKTKPQNIMLLGNDMFNVATAGHGSLYLHSHTSKYKAIPNMIMSQTRHLPDFHGAMQQPSGRLTSDLRRTMGSNVDVCMMALIAACLEK